MIVQIEKSEESCAGSLQYNEDKVLRGVAELIGYANVPSTDQKDILALFSRYERSAYYVSQKSFHASVNPSDEDTMSPDDTLSFICEMMSVLGYGQQPFLVYRHFDIEREHYHVVSVRVDRQGRKINNYYERYRLRDYLRRVGPRYGFTMVTGEKAVEKKESISRDAPRKARRFNPRGPVTAQLRDIYSWALGYDFTTFRELSFILEDLGVRVSLSPGEDAPEALLQGLDRKGAPCTPVFSEKALGEPLYGRAESALQERRASHRQRAREKERIRGLVGFAFGISKSESHLSNILANKGIRMHLSRTEDGRVIGITFVDHVTRSAFKGSELRGAISPAMMEEALSSGRWYAERSDGGGTQASRVRRSREAVRRDALRLRDLHVGTVARSLRPLGQPKGSSWSGKSAKTEQDLRDEWDEGRAGRLGADFQDRRLEQTIK